MSERIQLFDLELKISYILDITTLCFNSISKRNVAFYSSCSVRERKIKQQRLLCQFIKGKKERIISFFMIESKKRIAFVHKKKKR
jgi:hypothetical protein